MRLFILLSMFVSSTAFAEFGCFIVKEKIVDNKNYTKNLSTKISNKCDTKLPFSTQALIGSISNQVKPRKKSRQTFLTSGYETMVCCTQISN